jgi:hypothetical protein
VDQWNTKQRNKMEFVRNIKLPHIMSFCLTLQFSLVQKIEPLNLVAWEFLLLDKVEQLWGDNL